MFWQSCWSSARGYISIISVYNLPRLRTTLIDLIKGNGFTLKKARNRSYTVETIMDTDHANDRALLANIPTQTDSLPHSQEQATESIGIQENADKTEWMFF